MAQQSGKYATILLGTCEMLEFEGWTLDYGADIHETASRAGGGAIQTVEGIFRGSGQVSGYFDPNDPLTKYIVAGTLYTLTLKWITGKQMTGSARIGPISFGASREGQPVPVSFPFTTHGLWTMLTT